MPRLVVRDPARDPGTQDQPVFLVRPQLLSGKGDFDPFGGEGDFRRDRLEFRRLDPPHVLGPDMIAELEQVVDEPVPLAAVNPDYTGFDPSRGLVVEPVEGIGGAVGFSVAAGEGDRDLEHGSLGREIEDRASRFPPNKLKVAGVRIAVRDLVPQRVVLWAVIGGLRRKNGNELIAGKLDQPLRFERGLAVDADPRGRDPAQSGRMSEGGRPASCEVMNCNPKFCWRLSTSGSPRRAAAWPRSSRTM